MSSLRRGFVLSLAVVAALLAAARGPAETPAAAPAKPAGPRIVVLGTAQDGGMPQASCTCKRCTAARQDAHLARYVASLGIVLPGEKKLYLVDATPDVPRQLELLRPYRSPGDGRLDRHPLDGIFLTHAHMGHYLGLAHFGFESVHTDKMPVWGSQRMVDFLGKNGPWDQLVRFEEIRPQAITPGQPVSLGEGVSVDAFTVPHRDEYTDTLAYVIRGPGATVLYVPDTDTWQTWAPSLEERVASLGITTALLDATFYSMDELPWRDVTKVRHPLVVNSMDRLQGLVDAGKLKVIFTHLNHTNPALDDDSPERQTVVKRGFSVAREGQEIPL